MIISDVRHLELVFPVMDEVFFFLSFLFLHPTIFRCRFKLCSVDSFRMIPIGAVVMVSVLFRVGFLSFLILYGFFC